MKRFLILALMMWSAAASAAPSLSDTVEIRRLSGATASPDESVIVYRVEEPSLARNERRLSWWAVATDGSVPPRKVADGGAIVLTDAGPPGVQVPQWSSDSAWFYFRAQIAGEVQVWRASPRLGLVEQVSHDPADVEAFRLTPKGLIWRVRATRAAIQDAEAREYEQGVRIDGSVDPGQNLFAAIDINGRLASQRLAGRWFARRGLLGDQPAHFVRALANGDEPAPVASSEAQAAGLAEADELTVLFSGPEALASVSPFGRLKIERTRSTSRVWVTRAEGRRPLVCQHPRCQGRITSARWRPGRDVVVMTTTDLAHRQALVAWHVGRDRLRVLADTVGLIGGGEDMASPCALTRTHAFCVTADADTPPRLEAIDLDDGRRQTAAAPNTGLKLTGAERVEPLTWRDPAGRAFTGLFYPARPSASGKPPPLFVNYYACDGFVTGGVGDEWPFRAFVAAGIAGLCINTTPAPTKTQDSLASYQIAASGIEAIVAQLGRDHRIDATKVGMGGLSFGGEVTSWIATKTGLLTAISLATPQLEPTYYWIHGVAGRNNHEPMKVAWGLGDPSETAARWKLISPALNTDRLTAATLMQMSEQEYRNCPELLARLSNSTTPLEAFVFPNEPHIKMQPRHRLVAYQRNLDWFRFWLLGEEDATAGKLDQYQRWRALRDRAKSAPP